MTILHTGTCWREEAPPLSPAAALIEHHGQLLRQAALRAEQTLVALAAGDPTADAVAMFLDYLRAEVLPLTRSEDRLLRIDLDHDRRFSRDHRRLRAGVDALMTATRSPRPDAQLISGTVRGILDQLERHLRREDDCLLSGSVAQAPPVQRPATWYPLTEGPDVDLDLLFEADTAPAMLSRLRGLRPGQHLQIVAHRPLLALRVCVYRLDPHAECYRWTVIEDGPPTWHWLLRRIADIER